jgi:hypothetical protein
MEREETKTKGLKRGARPGGKITGRGRFTPDFTVNVRDGNNDGWFRLKMFRAGVSLSGTWSNTITPERHEEIEGALLAALEFWRSQVQPIQPRPTLQGPATIIQLRP